MGTCFYVLGLLSLCVNTKFKAMIVNDLQRLRWQILDECLRDPNTEYFMGGPKDQETKVLKSLLKEMNRRLRAENRSYKCSKRQLQLDVAFFESKGARLEPRFRRGHKRILRFINLAWKNPLLRVPGCGPLASPRSLLTLRECSDGDELVLRLAGRALEEVGQEHWHATVEIDAETKRLLWSYGGDVEVLSPEWLRREMGQQMLSLVQRYARKVNPEELQAFEKVSATEVSEKRVAEVKLEPLAPEKLDSVVAEVAPAKVVQESLSIPPAKEEPQGWFDFDDEEEGFAIAPPPAKKMKRDRKKGEEKKKEESQLNLFEDLF